MALGPNAALIGVPGGRARLDTPALLLDLDALERNVAAMAAHARAARSLPARAASAAPPWARPR